MFSTGGGRKVKTKSMRNPGESGRQRTSVLRKGAKPDPPSKTDLFLEG